MSQTQLDQLLQWVIADTAKDLRDPVRGPIALKFIRLIQAQHKAPKPKKDTSKARASSARARGRRADEYARWLYRTCLEWGAIDAYGNRIWTLQKIADTLNASHLFTRRHKPWNRKTVSRALDRAKSLEAQVRQLAA